VGQQQERGSRGKKETDRGDDGIEGRPATRRHHEQRHRKENDQGRPIQQPLDDDGRGRGRHRHAMATAQKKGLRQLHPAARGETRRRNPSEDCCARRRQAEGMRAHRSRHHPPAERLDHHIDYQQRKGERQPAGIGSGNGGDNCSQVQRSDKPGEDHKTQTKQGYTNPPAHGYIVSPVFPVFSVSPVFLMLGAHSPVENGGLATNSSVGSLLVFLSNRYAPIASCEGAKTVTFRRFEDILAWQAARRLASQVYAVSARGKFARDFALRDQIRRTTISMLQRALPENRAESLLTFSSQERVLRRRLRATYMSLWI